MNAQQTCQPGSGAEEPNAHAWDGVVFGMIYTYEMSPDRSSRVVWASAGVESIYELSPQDVVKDAEKVFERVHPDDIERVRFNIGRSFETLEPWREEYRVVLPKAGERWLRGEALPKKQKDGRVLWRGQIVDITEQKTSEHQWIQAAKMLSTLADASPKALFMATLGKNSKKELGLPYCSIGVANVFGVNPEEAMADPSSVWVLFDECNQKKGLEAFYLAKKTGQADTELVFKDARGDLREISLSLEWVGDNVGEKYWTGYASELGSSTRQDKAWDLFASALGQENEKQSPDALKEALRVAVGASACSVEWLDEPELAPIYIAHAGDMDDIEWSEISARVRVLSRRSHLIGEMKLEWSEAAQRRDLATVIRRASAVMADSWERRKRSEDLKTGLDEARAQVEKTAKMAAMGSLVDGVLHDLSSPLGNGALEIDVVKNKLARLTTMLAEDKVRKSELMALATGLYDIVLSAQAELNKARDLIEAFKTVSIEQGRAGKRAHEIGQLLKDMRASLHPTLRRLGVELRWAPNPNEIWGFLDASAAFNWLAKCAMSSANADKERKTILEVKAACKDGHALIEVAIKQADASQVERAMGVALDKNDDGECVARWDAGLCKAWFEDGGKQSGGA